MHWIDWCITLIPLTVIVGLAIYARRYIRGVVDYIAVGRVAGRYVISVGDMEAALGVISLVALVEVKYLTGYSLAYWELLSIPVGIIMSLTGYCTYRFRETKALSNGQFLEMRYSKSFRICGSVMRIAGEMLTNAIGPAIAANFFIYFLGLPHRVDIFGFNVPMFAIVAGTVIALSLIVMWPGGRLSLLITDCFQGLICYPIFVVIVFFVITKFSWSQEISPVMLDRVAHQSFFNPFDISELREFNLLAVTIVIFNRIFSKGTFLGNDTTGAGRTPHEQKMAGILGTWRNGFSVLMCLFVAVTIITVMSHVNFSGVSHKVRQQLSARVSDQLITDKKVKGKLDEAISKLPPHNHIIGKDKPLSQTQNLDTPYMETAKKTLEELYPENGRAVFQKYRTLYHQMMMPMALRNIFPVGILGLFCLLMVMLMLSTDDSRIFNASSAIIQDLVIPFRKTPLTPEQHLKLLRYGSLVVALIFFMCSLFFSQIDYIRMFTTIMVAIWTSGGGAVILFGLYSRFGTTAGAYAALVFGSGTTITGILIQRNWADIVYPFLEKHQWVDGVTRFFAAVSSPFNPYIDWQINPYKFPMNSYELMLIANILGVSAYIIVSLLTYKEPFNLDRLLHRGIYDTEGKAALRTPWTVKTVFGKLIGITPEYTRGDKIIAWSVFIYCFVYQIGICFVAVLIWNIISPWPAIWWSHYFYITSILVSAVIGVISTVWFLTGGIIDLRRLFRDLQNRKANPLDNGMVSGNVSLADQADFSNIKDGNRKG
ncbi:MAG: sodium:panthothenate symporter [Lentisphaeria bacterium]|nr:sodium:panthothenate symporter [Lentisphaeria bacterium]